MKKADIQRIAERHPDIPQEGFPELDYLTAATTETEQQDERSD